MMRGRIVYTVTLADTPAASPMFGTLNIGEQQVIDFRWIYTRLDPKPSRKRKVIESSSGVAEVLHFGKFGGFSFDLADVREDRNGVNDYAILNALNDELDIGTVITWYPDYISKPDQYLSCIAKTVIDPRRVENFAMWDFSFDLKVLTTVQIPSTVPPFVSA